MRRLYQLQGFGDKQGEHKDNRIRLPHPQKVNRNHEKAARDEPGSYESARIRGVSPEHRTHMPNLPNGGSWAVSSWVQQPVACWTFFFPRTDQSFWCPNQDLWTAQWLQNKKRPGPGFQAAGVVTPEPNGIRQNTAGKIQREWLHGYGPRSRDAQRYLTENKTCSSRLVQTGKTAGTATAKSHTKAAWYGPTMPKRRVICAWTPTPSVIRTSTERGAVLSAVSAFGSGIGAGPRIQTLGQGGVEKIRIGDPASILNPETC